MRSYLVFIKACLPAMKIGLRSAPAQVLLIPGVYSLLHLPVCAGGAGALLQPGHLLPVHQSEGGNSM